MKVALIHDYLTQYGGAEKTLENIMELYPNAPIYTGIYNPKKLPDFFKKNLENHQIHTLGNGLFKIFPKYLTFLMPFVFERFDLKEYDLIISDGTAWPKSVITNPNQLHISYVHTPPRFLYGYSVESTKRNVWYFKPIVKIIDHILRIWDFHAAQRPDYLLTNSKETQSRIKKYYKKDSLVIYPPVEIKPKEKEKEPKNITITKPYFLAAGRLSAYKNFDLLIEAINNTKYNLIIIGRGLEQERLKKIANQNIIIATNISDPEKHWLMENCEGLINTVDNEDFGIVPIEAQSHGKPVLAHRSGGHLETIIENKTGIYFDKLEVTHLKQKIEEFSKLIKSNKFDKNYIKDSVKKYSEERFKKEFKNFVDKKWDQFNKTNA